MNNLSFGTKIVVLIGAMCAFALALSGVIGWNAFSVRNSVQWNDHTHRVLGEVSGTLEAMLNQETGLRGYLVTGRDESLEPYRQGVAAVGRHLTTLQRLTSDNPVQQTRIAEVRRQADGWRTNVAERAIQLMAAPATREQALELERAGAGKQYFDAFRAALSQIRSAEEQLLEGRSSSLAASLDGIVYAVIGTAVGLLALSIGVFVLLSTGIARPVRRMTEAMNALAKGDLKVDVPGLGRKDEVGAMADAVQVFKDQSVALRQAEEDKRAQDARLAAERRRMMEELGAAVGSVVEAASRGDFSRRVEARFDDEELRRLGEGLNRLVGTVQGSLDDLMTVMSALGSGDLTTRVDKAYEGAFGALASGTNGTAEKLAEVIGRIGQAATTLDSAASEILAGANDLAHRTSTQAAMVEETAAAVEEFSTTVQTNASRASRASELARSAEVRATEGGTVMKEAQSAMGRIDEASARISEVVGLIENIAFQTNLLALNASVEAARAGEAGRGFAVVASEVRRLAQHASEASTEVKALISTSVTEVRSGVELVTRAGGSLEAIVGAINEVTSLMVEIAGVSKEQAVTIGEIGQAVRKLDEMTQQNAALVEETNSAIHMTEQQVNALNGTVGEFRLSGGQPRSSLRRVA